MVTVMQMQQQQQQYATYMNSQIVYQPSGAGAVGPVPDVVGVQPEEELQGQCDSSLCCNTKGQGKYKREVVHLRNLGQQEVFEGCTCQCENDEDDENDVKEIGESGGAPDSGCVSDVSSGVGDAPNVSDDSSDRLSQRYVESSDSHSDSSSQHSTSNVSSVSNNTDITSIHKVEFKLQNVVRSYNRPVSSSATKIVRPIKDIPPRFLKMLTPKSAQYKQSQFEGQPLVRHRMMGKGRYSASNVGNTHNESIESIPATHTFNPNAQCFVPAGLRLDEVTESGGGGGSATVSVDSTTQPAGTMACMPVDSSALPADPSSDGTLVMGSPPTYTILMNSPPVYAGDGVVCVNGDTSLPPTGFFPPPGSPAAAQSAVFYSSPPFLNQTYVCSPPSQPGPVVYGGVQYGPVPPPMPPSQYTYTS